MELKEIARKLFTCDVYLEYSMMANAVPLGERLNTMILYTYTEKPEFIEWVIEDPKGEADERVENIGLWFEGKTLTDYDGVFSLPKEAIEMLEELGYDMSYAKDDETIMDENKHAQ